MFERSHRWSVAVAVALVLAAAGVWGGYPVLLIAAMAPIVFVAYSALTSAPAVDDQLEFSRRITPTRTYAGEVITVELTVTNTGETPLADLRLVDGVPEELAVVEGSPRAALTLRSGQEATIEYALRARYGEFDFEPVTVRTHSVSAASIYTTTQQASGDTHLTAMFDPEEYPLAPQTSSISGGRMTDRGSEGLEFHSVRPYQPGDPASRINWRQYARDRVLTTVDYREEEAIKVLVIVDARPSAGVASGETEPTGTELCVSLANDIVTSLLADRNHVGVLTLGVSGSAVDFETGSAGSTEDSLAWVPPATTRETRLRIQQLLDAAAATVRPGDGPTESAQHDIDPREIIGRLDRRTQVVLLTPLCDEYPLELVQQFQMTGRTVSVYSPNVTASLRPAAGGRLLSAQRSLRIATLRRRGTTVVDWNPDEPLALALDRSSTTPTTHQPNP